MKKRTFIPTIISLASGIIILAGFISLCFIKEQFSLYSYMLLLISALTIIVSGIFTYYVHDRLYALIGLIGTILAFISIRMFFYDPIADYSLVPNWLLLIVDLAIIANLAGVILASYRLPINQQKFDNNMFGEVPEKQTFSLYVAIANILILFIVMVLEFMLRAPLITPIVCLITILVIIGGKILSYGLKKRIGSLIILCVPIIIILGVNPKEIALDNVCVILMVLEYVLAIALAIIEMIKVKPAEETKIGPKEYKK